MGHFAAVEDFRRARRRATMERILSRLSGKSPDLLSFEEVREKLRARNLRPRGLREIPLDAIVGSVGRYSDFTRSFLPRQDSDEERWTRVRIAVTDRGGLPPIDVYQIGDAYFVREGNHRVSVARQLGADRIQAYVTEVGTRVLLTPDVQPDELILKAEEADFLEETGLDRIRPTAEVSVTVPGRYAELVEHIEVHRYFMGLDEERHIPYEEAVGHWFDEHYWPVVQVIRERGILRDFPNRTEADLYLWLSEHRALLESALGWRVDPGVAAADLAAKHSPRPGRVAARVGERLLDAVTPDVLSAGPPAGQWRGKHLASRGEGRLFSDILVPMGRGEAGWRAVDQAIEVASREGGRLHGLRVLPPQHTEERESISAEQAEFRRRCERAGVLGSLVVDTGQVAHKIADQSRWTDLVVVSLAHPPGSRPLARLSSGFRNLLLWSPRPVMAVPGPCSPLGSALLAFDGSPKAREALFVAAYLAGSWRIPLLVVHVQEDDRSSDRPLEEAREYLDAHGIRATFLQETGPVATALLRTAEERGSELVLTGGYGRTPLLEIVLGSVVDEVLRASWQPVLVCR